MRCYGNEDVAIYDSFFNFFFHLFLKLNHLNSEIYCSKKIPIYISEQSDKDVGIFIPEFSVTGLLWSAASVVCDGNFQSFLPQCIQSPSEISKHLRPIGINKQR